MTIYQNKEKYFKERKENSFYVECLISNDCHVMNFYECVKLLLQTESIFKNILYTAKKHWFF